MVVCRVQWPCLQGDLGSTPKYFQQSPWCVQCKFCKIISSPSISIISCPYCFLHQLGWDRMLMQPEEQGGGGRRGSPKAGTQWAGLRSFPILPPVALTPILKGEEQRTQRVGAASQHSLLTMCTYLCPFSLQKQRKAAIEKLGSLPQSPLPWFLAP